jgi:hypothetical protein
MAQENEKSNQKYLSQISELQQLLEQSEVVRRELEMQVCRQMQKYARCAHETAPHAFQPLRACDSFSHMRMCIMLKTQWWQPEISRADKYAHRQCA